MSPRPAPPPDLAGRWLSKFFTSYLAGERAASPKTVSSYRDAMKLLLTWFRDTEGIPPEKLRLASIDRPRVLRFLGWLEAGRGCSAATRNQRLAVIKSFCRYTAVEHPDFLGQATQVLAIRQKSTPAPQLDHLTGDEVRMLLAEPGTASARAIRDTVLLALAYDTAARVQELRAWSASQADERLAAGGDWQDIGLVFTNHQGAALDAGNVRKMFKRVCAEAGIGDGWTPRELRTTFVSLLSHRGVSIEEIARLAGHASTRTTEIVYRRELRPVITTGAEIMDQLFAASQATAPAKRAFTGTPETHLRLAHAIHARPGRTEPLGLAGDSHQGDAIGHYAM